VRVPFSHPSARPAITAVLAVVLVGAALAGPAAAASPPGVVGPAAVRIFRVTPDGGGIAQVTIVAASRTVVLDARGLVPAARYELRASIGPSRPVLATVVATAGGTAHVVAKWKRPVGNIAKVGGVSLVRTIPPLVAVLSDGYWPDTCYPNYYEPPATCQWTFHAYDSTGPIVLYQLEYYMEDPAGNPSYGVPYRDNDPSLGNLGIYVTTGPGYYAEFTLTVYDIHGNTASDTNQILWAGSAPGGPPLVASR
jgi:hypothetical protein